ncbi:MAG: hypothetical protein ACOCVI_01410 [Planctomycetota bacterium]
MAKEQQKALFPELVGSEESPRTSADSLAGMARDCRQFAETLQFAGRNMARTRSRMRAFLSGVATLAAGPWGPIHRSNRWQRDLQRIRRSVNAGFLRDAINLHGDFSRALSREAKHQSNRCSDTAGDCDRE